MGVAVAVASGPWRPIMLSETILSLCPNIFFIFFFDVCLVRRLSSEQVSRIASRHLKAHKRVLRRVALGDPSNLSTQIFRLWQGRMKAGAEQREA